ncbi:MAG: HAD family hydrolase [Actinomycetota bacterium]|nr:HAD family hydrolase [Actinomycetota bacterium]
MSPPSASAVVAFSDLDRTLIYSRSAVEALGDPAEVHATTCVEVYDGSPQSFVAARAVPTLVALARTGRLVPTTTRTVEQFLRVRLPGPPPRYAICANGGHLLVDGAVDEDHHQDVVRRLDATSAPLREVLGQIARLTAEASAQPPFVERVRVASGLFCYLIVDRPRLPRAWLEQLEGVAARASWGVSLQGRKLYVVPTSLTKSDTAAEVLRRTGATSAVAAGDSLLDADLLEWAAAGIRPGHGELADSGWRRRHVEVTSSTGVRAGEEIARWLRERVS